MRGDIVNCKHCGTELVQTKWNHVYCSDNCADACRRGYRAQSSTNCEHCGDPVVPRDEKKGRKRKYCCSTCRLDHVRGNPIRPPEVRKAMQQAYLRGDTEYLKDVKKKRTPIVPEIATEEIGWKTIKAEMLEDRERRAERKSYGYRAGDGAITGMSGSW